MKRILRGFLTVWIVILLIVLGIVSNTKNILIDMTDGIVKTGLKTNIVKIAENSKTEKLPEEAIKKIENEIENNQTIKKLMNEYYDKIMNVLSSDEKGIQIDIAGELENLIDDSEEVLKDYGVTITEDQKQELLNAVSSSEINTILNDMISEVKDNLSTEVMLVINFYTFITSVTFKIILVVLVAIALLFIALLYKNPYSWLSNFGVASIITGVLIGIALPIVATQIITNLLKETNIVISIVPLSVYGYVLIGLGIIAIIIKIIISKKLQKISETAIVNQ